MSVRIPRLERWASRWPLGVALGLLALWFVVGGAAASLWALASGEAVIDDVPQTVARVAGSALVLALLWRAGWLSRAGVTRLGPVRAWLITLLALAILVPADLLALFGREGFAQVVPALQAEFPRLWLVQVSVGGAEELLFRGLLLTVLAVAWGRTGRGGLAAAATAGLLFAVPHLIHAAVGADQALAALNALYAFVSGFWVGALVLACGSIWPAVVIHAVTNLTLLSVPLAADAGGYLWLLVFELPWAFFGIWLLRRPVAGVRRAAVE